MGSGSSDRNLLVGILALQMDLIDSASLVRAMQAWIFQKGTSLEDLLLQQRSIDEQGREFLRGVAERHLQLHENDASRSLASLSAVSSIRRSLRDLGDSELEKTLERLPRSGGGAGSGAGSGSTFREESTIIMDGSGRTEGARFRILRPHATGGIGQVSVAEDMELHREVALKEMQDRFAHDPATRSRFLVEAEVTGRLEHPGIVPVYGLGQTTSGTPFYVMRFIRGDSLREAVERLHQTADFADVAARRLELRKLVGRLVDVCHAVAYAHSRGVLHRDLKPGNIMLGKYGETLVVDWGLAKSVGRPELYRSGEEGTVVPTSGDASSDTRMGMVVGTLAYMSPEQAEGRLDAVGPLSDVYSLGSTLYCILTGKAPIEKEDATEMIAAVRLGRYRKPRELAAWVPPALEAICLKAMSLHPVSRYASPTALADELELWLADEPVSAWREPWPARVARWSRRNRSLIGTAIGGLTATTAAAVVIMGLVSAQNADLRAKNVAIERGNAEILRQRDMLDQNRGLLSELSVGVLTAAETQLANVSGVDLFRSSVMERSFRTFEQLYQQDKSNPEIATYLAQSARLSGNQLSRVAQRPAAIERLQMSIELQQKSPQTAAGDTAALDYLAGTLRDLGENQSSQGRLSDAQKSFTEAADILATMLAKAPQNPNIRRTAATLSLPQAGLLLELDKFEQALALAKHSAEVLVELSESPFANPVDPVLAMLAIAQQGRTLDELGRHAEAREVFASGIAKGRGWMQKFADSLDMKYAFSRLLHWDADGNARSGPVTEERIQQLDEAIGICEELQQARPQSLGYLYNLGDAQRTRGRIFREKTMYPEATEILQKSADVLKRRLEMEDTASSHEVLSTTLCEQAETQLAQANKPAAAEFWKTAVQHLQQAEQLSPESQSIKRSLQTVEERLKAAGE